jgi:hypothetical protein
VVVASADACFTYETFASIGQTKGEILRWALLQKS